MSVTEALQRVVRGEALTTDAAAAAMTTIMEGEATPAQVAALLTALRMKGETVEEIAGFARVMREKSVRLLPTRAPLVDTCGTGGDTLKTFNISTAAAFVAAGAGVGVAKHGNRSVTSKSGSADVLEELGVTLAIPPAAVETCIDRLGVGFLFAPNFHPAMKHAAPVRREIGIRTVFNILGPLTNPAGAPHQVVGVYDAALTEPLAQVLGLLGARRAFVVHGLLGLDEWSTAGATQVSELRDGAVTTRVYTPADVGLADADPADLLGGTPAENAELIWALLRGQGGPQRDIILLNAAAALVAAGAAADIPDGLQQAAVAIDGGAALAKLQALRELTRELAPA
ncbi:MAG TPA: anthranilate phosphoribosyltransferase [Armatimonadota bacterium]|nr:anthranilate phosphoribosyltransferase [Armatimonadota bacterium]